MTRDIVERCLPRYLILLFLLALAWPASAAVESEPLHIYIDADWSNSLDSSLAIEQGLRTALSLQGDRLDSFPVKVLRLDHRANSRRQMRNMELFADDPRGLVVMAGLHSPPLLANKKHINKMHLLTLVPWAAAGPITRAPEPNYLFRLSVDDAVAGRCILRHAVILRGFTKLAILAEDTAWGRFNIKNMTQTALELELGRPRSSTFNWGIALPHAKMLLRETAAAGAQAVILVANPAESVTFVKAMAELEPEFQRPFQSHWGCSAGFFVQRVGLEILNSVDLEFIQSKFSFLSKEQPPLAQQAFEQAKQLFPENIRTREDIHPPDGFIHAFDLGLLLGEAARQATLSGDMKHDRAALHQALEDLRRPVTGLVKTYVRPFSPWSREFPDAHEALGFRDYAMARYDRKGRIVLERP